MAKNTAIYSCTACGYESVKWLGKCPSCSGWNTFTEKPAESLKKNYVNHGKASVHYKIADIAVDSYSRIQSGFQEFDRVLGGGVVPGSLVLIGGEPGIGKSTLMLQAAELLSGFGTVLYVSGEESGSQIKMRSERMQVTGKNIEFLGETELEGILSVIDEINPLFLVVDSIQTCHTGSIEKAPGTVTQIKEVTHKLLEIAKTRNIATFIIGHVTKDGMIAGPKILEHIVDTVLYFESNSPFLILRAVKNRFGNTDEIGIFSMEEKGIRQVENPHEIFLDDTEGEGIAIASITEGTRTLLLEVQALVSNTTFASPRRLVDGIEINKVNKLVAVIEKRLGVNLSAKDVYINLVGGIKVREPAVDLAIAAAILSSVFNKTIDKKSAFIGELGLTGEIRNVSRLKERVSEAVRLGITDVYIPSKGMGKDKWTGVNVHPLLNIGELAKQIGITTSGN